MAGQSELQPILDETRRGQIVRKLREMIVSGNVEPGERLTEASLASSLGVSRAPLREAIRELVESGLVESVPYKGLFVRNVTRSDLRELYSLRTRLEQFAFEECWNNRTPEAIDGLYARHHALLEEIEKDQSPHKAIELELILHSWCYELSNHSLLQKMWQQMMPNLQFYFILHQRAHNRPGPLREAHDIYIKCATGDKLSDMLEHLEQHMRQGLETTIADLTID